MDSFLVKGTVMEKLFLILSDLFQFLKKFMLFSFDFVLSHKKLIFVYIPAFLVLILTLYTVIIYAGWRSDRKNAMDKLSRYKQLIDRTEEMKRGLSYTSNDVDLSAKVVDIPTRIYDRNC